MTKKELKEIEDICWQIRNNLPTEHYLSNMEGLCAIATVEIFNKLKEKGYDPIMVHTDLEYGQERIGEHFFIEVNRYIVDVTATQFDDIKKDVQPVEIRFINRQLREDYIFWGNLGRITFKSVDDLNTWMCNTNWPDDQIPCRYKKYLSGLHKKKPRYKTMDRGFLTHSR